MPRNLGHNLPRVKRINRSLVLEQLLFHGPMNRQQIAKNLGLTTATISNIVAQLIREGLIYEVGPVVEDRVGRKSVTLGLRGDRYAVLGIHLRATDMEIGLVGLDGTVFTKHSSVFPSDLTKRGFLQFIGEQIDIQMGLRGRLNVVAVGVGSRGLLNSKGDTILISPDQHIDTVGLERELQSYVNLPIVIRSNAVGMALAEKMFGLCKATDNFLLVYMGPNGIGSGLVFNGESYQGTGITTTGFGHMMYSESGPKCPNCGRTGCLELYASEAALLQLCNLNSIDELLLRAQTRDPLVLSAIEEAARKISVVLTSFLSMIDLRQIVFGGTLAFGTPLVREVQKRMNQYAGEFKAPIDILTSMLGSDLGLSGAAAPAILEHVIRSNEFVEAIL